MFRKSICGLMICGTTAYSQVAVTTTDLHISPDTTLWNTTAKAFSESLFSRSNYGTTTEFMYSSEISPIQLEFLGMDFPQAHFHFSGRKLDSIRLNLYNIRDREPIPADFSQPFKTAVQSRVSEWLNMKPLSLTPDKTQWQTEYSNTSLIVRTTKNSIHDVQLTIERRPASGHTALRTTTSISGDVILDGLPVVHQIKSGYCGPASLEISFRSLGIECNLFELAHQTGTTLTSGSDETTLFKTFSHHAAKVGYTTEHRFKIDDLDQFTKMVTQYNTYCRKQQLRVAELKFIDNNGVNVCSLTDTLSSFDNTTYKQFKTRYQSDAMEHFFSAVCNAINSETPVVWSCMNGFETDSSRKITGHVCVINGYNKATRELIFTDPKGMEGRNLRISLADAWTKNLGVYLLSK